MRKTNIKILLLVLALAVAICGCAPVIDSSETPSLPISSSDISETLGPADENEPSAEDSDDTQDNSVSTDREIESSVPPVPETSDPPESPAPSDVELPPAVSSFEVHFIDVGQGDSSLIICDGEAMLIDGGEASESSKIYAYLKSHGIEHLEYIVATHAHSDHIGGLSGALNYATVSTALCPVTEYDSKTFNSFVKYLGNQGVSITVPSAGDIFKLGSSTVTVLGPVKEYDEPNDTSIVLRVDYGNTSFLFTGDAERTAEADIIDSGANLSVTVLKVGHHGSDTSTSYPFLREVMPEYAVIQVGKDNSYGHPTEDTLSKLRDADVKVYRNDLQGTIVCSSDGETVSFSTERNASAQTNPTVTDTTEENGIEDTDTSIEYIGNKNSKKFHLPTCKNLPAEKNRVFFDSRQEAIDAGFDPCGNCNP